jgi:hypothetical protein
VRHHLQGPKSASNCTPSKLAVGEWVPSQACGRAKPARASGVGDDAGCGLRFTPADLLGMATCPCVSPFYPRPKQTLKHYLQGCQRTLLGVRFGVERQLPKGLPLYGESHEHVHNSCLLSQGSPGRDLHRVVLRLLDLALSVPPGSWLSRSSNLKWNLRLQAASWTGHNVTWGVMTCEVEFLRFAEEAPEGELLRRVVSAFADLRAVERGRSKKRPTTRQWPRSFVSTRAAY